MQKYQRKSDRTGAVAVEFAMTAPLLFFILFGALELSHANMVFNVAEAAAYEGARQGIVPGAAAADVTAASQRLLDISKVRGATVNVVPGNLSTVSRAVQVDISVPYAQNTLIPPFFTRSLVIQRTCTLDRENAS